MNLVKNYIDKEFFALGTINYIKIYDCYDEEILNQAVKRVNEIEHRMSAFLPDSDISRINQKAGIGFATVHKDTLYLLERGILFSKLSHGAFDMTIRPLVKLWGIGKKNNYIPTEDEIKFAKTLVNYNDISIHKKKGSAALTHSGQSIDLGGIAKGYAADEVKRILKENQVISAVINLGGNVITIGNRPDGEHWQIGIQNPLASTGKYLGILSVPEKTIVTSGSNERFFIKDGIRYHHILDPRTGKPATSSLLSVTVICDSSLKADALTTALFVLGMEDGIKLLDTISADAIFLTENLEIYITEGIRKHFQLKQ